MSDKLNPYEIETLQRALCGMLVSISDPNRGLAFKNECESIVQAIDLLGILIGNRIVEELESEAETEGDKV